MGGRICLYLHEIEPHQYEYFEVGSRRQRRISSITKVVCANEIMQSRVTSVEQSTRALGRRQPRRPTLLHA